MKSRRPISVVAYRSGPVLDSSWASKWCGSQALLHSLRMVLVHPNPRTAVGSLQEGELMLVPSVAHLGDSLNEATSRTPGGLVAADGGLDTRIRRLSEDDPAFVAAAAAALAKDITALRAANRLHLEGIRLANGSRVDARCMARHIRRHRKV